MRWAAFLRISALQERPCLSDPSSPNRGSVYELGAREISHGWEEESCTILLLHFCEVNYSWLQAQVNNITYTLRF